MPTAYSGKSTPSKTIRSTLLHAMRKLFFLTFLLLGLGCQAQQSNYSLDFKLSMREFADTLDIVYDNYRVYLPVGFNGRQYRFLLDTGASQTTIFEDSDIEGITELGHTMSHDAMSWRSQVRKVALPPMQLGGLTLTGCQAVVQQRVVSNGSDFDGIIGFDVVCRGVNMKIDTRAGRLILSDRHDFFEKEGGGVLKYKLNLHVPYIEVIPFQGYQERVLFDTGSRQLYAQNKSSCDLGLQKTHTALPSLIEGRSMGRYAIGHGGVEPRGEVLFLNLDSLVIGPYTFSDFHTPTTQGASHVGARVLEYGAVVFNPKRRRMRFQPYDDVQQVAIGNQQFDKAIVPVNGRPVVGLVWEGGDAYKAGFREGDVIMMADQRPLNTFADYLRFRPIIGHVYTILVRDVQGNMKELQSTW